MSEPFGFNPRRAHPMAMSMQKHTPLYGHWCSQSRPHLGILRLYLRLVQAVIEGGCVSLVSYLQQLVILFEIGHPPFLNRGLHLDFGVRSGRNWSKFGRHKSDKTKPPIEP